MSRSPPAPESGEVLSRLRIWKTSEFVIGAVETVGGRSDSPSVTNVTSPDSGAVAMTLPV